MSRNFQSFAIVPACGRSQRMGTDKLSVAWNDSTVLETVIDAWLASDVDQVAVVIPVQRDDLRRALRDKRIEVVTAEAIPPDMKGTVQLGLAYIAERLRPRAADCWLVAPADMPTLAPETINQVIAKRAGSAESIILPVCGEKRGHPALFPWKLSAEVDRLTEEQGLDTLCEQQLTVEVPVESLGEDFNTPEELQDLRNRYES